jgi:hypothetical protein
MKLQWYQEMPRYGCSCCSLLLDRILDRLLDRWRLEGDGARVEGRRWRVGAVRLGCRGGGFAPRTDEDVSGCNERAVSVGVLGRIECGVYFCVAARTRLQCLRVRRA